MTTDTAPAPRQHELLPVGAEEGPAGIQLAMQLEEAGALTPTKLELTDPNLPYEQYVALGRFLARIKRSSSWWIGDWINFGEGVYGEKYAQAVEATGLDTETLQNYRWVAEKVPPTRRVATLAFSIHQCVAALEPDAQREWLQRTLDEGWNRDRLRHELREAKAVPEREQTALGEAARDATNRIEEAAKSVARQATRRGSEFVVPAEPMLHLQALLGIGE